MLHPENAILRKRLEAHEKQIEISALAAQKIYKMSTEELKAKIIKVAQAFNFIYSFKYIQYIEMNVYEMKKNLQKLLNTIAQACQMQQELEVFQRTQEIKDSALQGNNKKIRKSYCKIRGIDGRIVS
eukprot:TRINITY_DN1195_c0_g1_i14.p4 TRINITY_DN1195_c0_g1~~TRINITY_DN1195_c0_g1_i14.p4  ORF type:complete len:127 (+),score=17.00 TRINITY_DN1195_c0_g1_i14:922-1302(+)